MNFCILLAIVIYCSKLLIVVIFSYYCIDFFHLIQKKYWPGVERPSKSDTCVWVKMGSLYTHNFWAISKIMCAGIDLLDFFVMWGFCVSDAGPVTRICLQKDIYIHTYSSYIHTKWKCTYFVFENILSMPRSSLCHTHKIHQQHVLRAGKKKWNWNHHLLTSLMYLCLPYICLNHVICLL